MSHEKKRSNNFSASVNNAIQHLANNNSTSINEKEKKRSNNFSASVNNAIQHLANSNNNSTSINEKENRRPNNFSASVNNDIQPLANNNNSGTAINEKPEKSSNKFSARVENAVRHFIDDTSTPIDKIIEELDKERITTPGGRPYVCDICGRGFVRKPHMIKHRARHDSDDSLQEMSITSYFDPDEPSTR